jgi:hypothetical protein
MKWLENLDSAVLIAASGAFSYGLCTGSTLYFAASAVLFYGSRLTFKKLVDETVIKPLHKIREALGEANATADDLAKSSYENRSRS